MTVFPDHFMWGTASSASQSEGGWNEGRRGKSIQDVITSADARGNRLITWNDKFSNPHASSAAGFHVPMDGQLEVMKQYYYPNHFGVDFYHRWREDLDLLQQLGVRCFWTSISWSRIFPGGTDETPNPEGLAFYRELFQELKSRGIEPVVTLFRDDAPLTLESQDDGWNGRKIIDEFVRYAEVCMQEYKDLVKYWVPVHEVNGPLVAFSQKKKLGSSTLEHAFRLTHHLLLASARVAKLGHEISPDFQIGGSLASVAVYPSTPSPQDVRLANDTWACNILYAADGLMRGRYPVLAEPFWKRSGLDIDLLEEDKKVLAEGTCDFLSFSYFTSHTVSASGQDDDKTNYDNTVINPYLEYSPFLQSVDPQGLEIICRALYSRYEKPLFIAENGYALDEPWQDEPVEDTERIAYLQKMVETTGRLLEDGVELMGYSVWSFTDVIASGSGTLKQRYGLVHVNRDDEGNGDFARSPKASFDWYKKVIASNGADLSMEETE